jgi:hypothetical protein
VLLDEPFLRMRRDADSAMAQIDDRQDVGRVCSGETRSDDPAQSDSAATILRVRMFEGAVQNARQRHQNLLTPFRVKTAFAGGCLGLEAFSRPSRTVRSTAPATDGATRAGPDGSTKGTGNLTETGQTLRKHLLDIRVGLCHNTSLTPGCDRAIPGRFGQTLGPAFASGCRSLTARSR